MRVSFLAGAQKLARIRENSNFFRSELQKMGFEVLGDNDSPVMPIMLYNPAKIPAFSRECLKQNVSHHPVMRSIIGVLVSVDFEEIWIILNGAVTGGCCDGSLSRNPSTVGKGTHLYICFSY